MKAKITVRFNDDYDHKEQEKVIVESLAYLKAQFHEKYGAKMIVRVMKDSSREIGFE